MAMLNNQMVYPSSATAGFTEGAVRSYFCISRFPSWGAQEIRIDVSKKTCFFFCGENNAIYKPSPNKNHDQIGGINNSQMGGLLLFYPALV